MNKMKRKYVFKCLLIIALGSILLNYSQLDKMKMKKIKGILGNVNWMLYNSTENSANETMKKIDKTSNKIIPKEDEFNFITVICCRNPAEDGINEVIVQSRYLNQLIALLKSAALTTHKILRFQIVTNIKLNQLQETVGNITSTWPKGYRSMLQLNYSKIYYPPGTDHFKKMGNPCVTQRLFFADMYNEMNAAVYLDLDTIFLRAPEDIWDEFQKFDDYQVAAVGDSTFYKGRKIPYYGGGINPGIMMMNMTRMRQLMTSMPVKDMWSSAMINIVNTYKEKVHHDMDILNVFFKMNPRFIYILPCWWSFIKTYCKPEKTLYWLEYSY